MAADAPYPVNVQLDRPQKQVVISWSDGFRMSYPWTFLRANCPSAGERVEREEANPLAVLGKPPSSELVEVRVVGNYALGLTWSDGHNAGIYTWELLRQLGEDDRVATEAIG